MTKLIQKKFHFVSCNNYYGGQNIDVPEGFQFVQFITKRNGDYDETYAIFAEYAPMQEIIEELKKKDQEARERTKVDLEKKVEERIKNMNLYQKFSDIISKFKIGDEVYWYKDDLGWGKVAEENDHLIEKHIERFTLKEIHLRDNSILIKDNKEDPDELVLVGWNDKLRFDDVFKTKEEAIAGSKAHHAERMKNKEIKKAEEEKKAEENRKKREQEILDEAEKIKNSKK